MTTTDNEITYDLSGIFAEQADVMDRLIRQRDRARRWAVDMEQREEQAALRILAACDLLDELIDHAPEECDCDHEGRVCLLHKLDDALRGVR